MRRSVLLFLFGCMVSAVGFANAEPVRSVASIDANGQIVLRGRDPPEVWKKLIAAASLMPTMTDGLLTARQTKLNSSEPATCQ